MCAARLARFPLLCPRSARYVADDVLLLAAQVGGVAGIAIAALYIFQEKLVST